jgi:hypothetical protein
MTNGSWIEAPPPQRGLGCFGKGCVILVVFVILLGLAFVAGTYFAARYLRTEYFSTHHVRLPANTATVEEEDAVRARWDSFRKAAHEHEAARIELSAEDLNALIASEPKLRGNAHVSIENNVGRLQVSIPLHELRWWRSYYVNAQCSVESADDGNPAGARITSIIVNDRPVGEEALSWQYGSWSVSHYISDFSDDNNLKTFEITDGKVILETKGGE